MKLINKWKELTEAQTNETFDAFWEEYSSAEITIYKDILARASGSEKGELKGVFSELAEHYAVSDVMFIGFLDGVMSSLTNEQDIDEIDESSNITLEIDLEKLLFNMYAAKAEHLFSLDEWNDIFDDVRKKEIFTKFKRSRTVVKDKKIGRNEPCPCGSGKKYKKCCGK